MHRPFSVLADWIREGRLQLADTKPLSQSEPMPIEALEGGEELSEAELFSAAMQDVRPRHWNDAGPFGEPSTPASRDADREALLTLEEFCRSGRVEVHQTREYVEHSVHPVGRLYLEDLRSGRFAIQAHLDLHGLNLEQAKLAVDDFVRGSVRAGHSSVRIIHGRGLHSVNSRPLMKHCVEQWLRQRRLARFVLAYTSARLVDGGGGAVYVLLRSRTRGKF